MKLGEWPKGEHLDGVIVAVPAEHRRLDMSERMAIKSGWAIEPKIEGDEPGIGLWLIEPGQKHGRVFPVFLTRQQYLDLEVIDDA